MTLLRLDLLEGTVVIAAGPGSAPARAAASACADLGASVRALAVDPFGEEPVLGAVPGGEVVLVWDGVEAFGSGGVRAALDGAWLAVRAVANAAMIPEERGGKIVLLAPVSGDAHAEAARAGLENLARTLSVEWARFQIRIVAVLGGSADDAAAVVAFLASAAGDYYSGCALTLRSG